MRAWRNHGVEVGMTSDRRRHLRVCVPGAFCDLIVGGVSVGLVSVEDVSESGVFLSVPHPVVPLRTAVELRFIEEAAPFILIGTIVQVVPPGGPRSSGYGIELVVPPANTVERVADKMLAQGSLTLPMPGLYVQLKADNLYHPTLGFMPEGDVYNPGGFVS